VMTPIDGPAADDGPTPTKDRSEEVPSEDAPPEPSAAMPEAELEPEAATPEPERAAREPVIAVPEPELESRVEAPITVSPEPAPVEESRSALEEEDLWEEAPSQPEPRVKPPSSPAPPGELPQRRVVVIDENSDIDIRAGQEQPQPPQEEHLDGMVDIGATLDEEKGRKRRWRMFRKGGD
jgi:hypothetical protein